MRSKWSWVVAVFAALTLAAWGAQSYARFVAPAYLVMTRLMASGHPWKVLEVAVVRDAEGGGAVLRLIGEVRRARGDARPAALVVSRLQVGEVVETPLVFWALVLLWPARDPRQRLLRGALGVPVFLLLETATTGCQLLHSLAQASAVLAGESDPLTLWERWSRFLEAGGRFALEVAAAVLTVALTPGQLPARTVRR